MLLSKTGFHPAFAWLIFMTTFMVIPGSDIPEEDWFQKVQLDKFVHVLFFSVLIYLFYRPVRYKPNNWLPWISLCAFAYGVLIEFVQEHWAIDRSFDKWDIIADAFGCIAGYFFCLNHRRNRLNRKHRRSRNKK